MTNKECIEQVNIIADKVLGAFDTHICDMEELDRQVIAAYLFGMINAYQEGEEDIDQGRWRKI